MPYGRFTKFYQDASYYARHEVLPPNTFWSENGESVNIEGSNCIIADVRKLIQKLLLEAYQLMGKCLVGLDLEDVVKRVGDHMGSSSYADDLGDVAEGQSYFKNPNNSWIPKCSEELLDSMAGDAFSVQNGNTLSWDNKKVDQWFANSDELTDCLLFLCYILGGPSPRATEFVTMKSVNCDSRPRNLYILSNDSVCLLGRYNKTSTMRRQDMLIPRILPKEVGRLLIISQAYLRPVQMFLSREVLNMPDSAKAYRKSLFVSGGKEVGDTAVLKVFKKFCGPKSGLAVPRTPSVWRHFIIGVGRAHLLFPKGLLDAYVKCMPLSSIDGYLAGHSSKVDKENYSRGGFGGLADDDDESSRNYQVNDPVFSGVRIDCDFMDLCRKRSSSFAKFFQGSLKWEFPFSPGDLDPRAEVADTEGFKSKRLGPTHSQVQDYFDTIISVAVLLPGAIPVSILNLSHIGNQPSYLLSGSLRR